MINFIRNWSWFISVMKLAMNEKKYLIWATLYSLLLDYALTTLNHKYSVNYGLLRNDNLDFSVCNFFHHTRIKINTKFAFLYKYVSCNCNINS